MKQLIEEQKEFNEKFSYIADALDFYTKAHYPTIKKSGTEHLKDITDWHKQSLKQFIDGLIERENEIVSTMEDYYPKFEFRMGLISGKNETISHLKKLKEELN